MFYDRQVKYFDDMIQGERKGNSGFVKIEVRGCVCNISFCIKGLGKEDFRQVSVYLECGDRTEKLCSVELEGGNGTKQLFDMDAENIGNTGVSYHDLEGIKIPLTSDRELCAVLKTKIGQAEEKRMLTVESELVIASEPEEETVEEIVEEVTEEKPIVEETMEENSEEENFVPEGASRVRPSEKKSMPLQDTKWKQLWEIYPHISPFQDGRKYLSVAPGDFVLLPEKYFAMVNNSFLLHGYYNYHHLVLKRLETQGQVKYYIGVPGNYYDREKQVAVMFGFEGFESMQEPAEAGDFGYYLMGIEL